MHCKQQAHRCNEHVHHISRSLEFYCHAGNECHAEQAAGNKLVSELGGLVEAAAVNVSTAEEAQVTAWGVDGKQLQQKPCEAQLLLVPFGDSADSDEWQKYTGES